jgi:dTDP-4-amino-4,6-dideoxygalactose transaminase
MTSRKSPVYVTQPYLPPLESFIPYLEEIWERKWLTNNGPFHQQLEKELCEHLGVEHLSLFANGTLALITALQALRITGHVITTPYSFVATSHALHWNGIKPIFVDIDPVTFNIDPYKLESAITPETTAILPVHVYGTPCNTEQIERIADIYGLRVIYDAAHAFGVKVNDQTIFSHGDLSVLSFHATKVFNTFEGGAIICRDHKMKQRIDYLKNFGFADEVTVVAPGINAKMDEVHAAFGLLQLKHTTQVATERKRVSDAYHEALRDVPGITLPYLPKGVTPNYSYFPLLIEADFPISRDALYEKLRAASIFSRRYFFPLISEFPMYRGLESAKPENLPVAQRVSNSIICLPIYPDLTNEDIGRVVEEIYLAAQYKPPVDTGSFSIPHANGNEAWHAPKQSD